MSTIPPYNKGMRSDFAEEIIKNYREEEKRRANEELCLRLSEGKSFEDMLQELASLRGLKVREKMCVAASDALPA